MCTSSKINSNSFSCTNMFFFCFFSGLLLCVCIAFCNVAVMLSLWFKSNQNVYGSNCYPGDMRIGRKHVLMRRSISKMSTNSTWEEVAFGRLMGLLCVIFIVCWMPQLVRSLIYWYSRKKSKKIGIVAISRQILPSFQKIEFLMENLLKI